MLISSSAIMKKIEEEFGTVYKPFSGFPDSGSLWNECIKTVKDDTLMNHIIFNNDVMQIPPVKTFLKANKTLTGGFTNYQKKALGAFWGFVFKSVFLYDGQKDNVPVGVKDIKKAARFTDPKSEVVVGELDDANGQTPSVPKYKLRLNLVEPKEEVIEPVETEGTIEPSTREIAAEPVLTEAVTEPVESEAVNEPVEREAVTEPIEREAHNEPVERESAANPFDQESVDDSDTAGRPAGSPKVSPWNERMEAKDDTGRY